MLPSRKKSCAEVARAHKMKLEEKRVSVAFVGLMGNNPSLHQGRVNLVCLKTRITICLFFFFFSIERRFSGNPPDVGLVPVQSVSKDKFPTLNPITQKFPRRIIWG